MELPVPPPDRLRWISAAALAAAPGATLAAVLSAPALTRPFLPAAAFLLLLPIAAAGALAGLLSLLPWARRRPRAAAPLAALIAVLPWLAVAAAPMGRLRLAALLGAAVVVAAAWLLTARPGAAWSAPLVAALALAWPQQGPIVQEGEGSCVILGFDGATWDQVEPLMARGEMPAFAALRERSAHGVLVSEPPTASPVVWTTIATGVSPEEHGIRNFGCTRADLRAGRIWDEVAARGGSAGVVGWLMNWPPDPTLRFSVPSWLEGGDRAVPAPAGFAKRLELQAQGGGSPLAPSNLPLLLSALAVSSADNAWRLLGDALWLLRRPDPEDVNWRLRLLQARLQTDLFLELMARARPQFGALVTYPTDSLGHYYWMYHEPALYPDVTPEQVARRGEVVRDAYRTADYNLGKVAARLDLERTTLILTSDHGMQALPAEERRMRVREKVILHLLDMEGAIHAATVTHTLVLTPAREGAAGDADLARAAALLEAARVEGEEGGPALFEVQRHPSQPRTIHAVLTRAPAGPEARIRVGERAATAAELLTRESRSGQHTLNGLFLLAGPGVRPQGGVMTGVRHVAPLALHALGLEIPEDLRAQFPHDQFFGSSPEARPIRRRAGGMIPPPPPLEADADPDKVAQQLEALGYVQ